MPDTATGSLRTPPAIQGSVIALRASGRSKRSIAEELSLDRQTVDRILAAYQQDDQSATQSLTKQLVSSALGRVTQAIDSDRDTDTARWALEHTIFKPEAATAFHFHDDATMQQLNTMSPVPPSQAGSPVSTSSPALPSSTESTGAIEAAAKPHPGDLSLSSNTNFFPILFLPNVTLTPHPAGVMLLVALWQAAQQLQRALTVTSGSDGQHSGPADPHHEGKALDVRSHDLPDKQAALRVIMAGLGQAADGDGGLLTEKFFGWLEAAGTENEHIHVQLRHGVSYP